MNKRLHKAHGVLFAIIQPKLSQNPDIRRIILQQYDVCMTYLTARIWLVVAVWSLGDDVHGYLTVFVLCMYTIYFYFFPPRVIIVLIKKMLLIISSRHRLREFE